LDRRHTPVGSVRHYHLRDVVFTCYKEFYFLNEFVAHYVLGNILCCYRTGWANGVQS